MTGLPAVAVADLVAGLTFAKTAPGAVRNAVNDGHRPGRARISRAAATVAASSGSKW